MALHDREALHDRGTAWNDDLKHHLWVTRKEVSDEMTSLCKDFLRQIKQTDKSGRNVSPLLLYWGYQAAQTYAELYSDTADEEYLDSCEVVEETLRVLDRRWRLAGLPLIEETEDPC
jgi:hypothetical protein